MAATLRPNAMNTPTSSHFVSYSASLLSSAKLTGWALALSALLAMHAHAEQATQSSPQPSIALKQIVITTSPETTPLTVVTDPKAPRQPVPASDGADYLKTIPGFATIRNGGTNGDPVFRGMFGSRLNIRSDGGVILGACGQRMDNPTSYISPESYDRLTLIKGPQTVKWGPTGSAGTILFERDPRHYQGPTIEGDSSILFGSNGRIDARVDATVGDRLGYIRMTGNKSRSNDYKDGAGDKVPSKWDKWNTDLFMGFTPDSDTLLEISGGIGDGEARYAGRGMDGTQFKRETLGLKFVKSNLSEHLEKIEAQLYYNYADHIMDNFRLRDFEKTKKSGGMGMGMGMGHMMMNMPMESRLDRKTLGGRLAATWNWDDHALVTGVDAQSNKHRNREKRGMMGPEIWNPDARFFDYGVFAEWTWNFADNQRLVAGSRLGWSSAEDEREKSPTFKDKRNKTLFSGFLRYENDLESAPVTTYVGIGYTDRFPDYWELFSPQQASGSALNAFDGLSSEKTTQIDFGAQYSSGDTNIWGSGYIGWIDDYILFDYSHRHSMATNVNARIMGAELGISQQFLTRWKGEASLAYAWGQNTTDNEPLPQMPPLEARFGLTYEHDDWSIGALWRLVAPQTRVAPDKGNVVGKDYDKSAGFGVLSVNATYKLNKNVNFSAGIDNLLNKEYTEHLNKDGDAGFGFPAHYQVREPGRMFWAKADFKF